MKKYQLEIYCIEAEVHERLNWVDYDDVELPREMLLKMADQGIIDIKGRLIRADHIGRAYKALRLRSSLGVNFSGAAIILDLLDRIERLNEELEQRRRKYD
ncbi:MAG TPA: hypothetical protein GXZ24_00595 [Firmicutes bacterium]|jgi:MerR family transcriptional regulator/heat shock protein HspR|nr:hypothetical protein [Bacillota bacterium]